MLGRIFLAGHAVLKLFDQAPVYAAVNWLMVGLLGATVVALTYALYRTRVMLRGQGETVAPAAPSWELLWVVMSLVILGTIFVIALHGR
jgi:hypothetical protein